MVSAALATAMFMRSVHVSFPMRSPGILRAAPGSLRSPEKRRPPRPENLWTCKRACGECGHKYPRKATGFIEAGGNVDRIGGILLTPPALTQCHAGTIASGRPALPRMVPRAL